MWCCAVWWWEIGGVTREGEVVLFSSPTHSRCVCIRTCQGCKIRSYPIYVFLIPEITVILKRRGGCVFGRKDVVGWGVGGAYSFSCLAKGRSWIYLCLVRDCRMSIICFISWRLCCISLCVDDMRERERG